MRLKRIVLLYCAVLSTILVNAQQDVVNLNQKLEPPHPKDIRILDEHKDKQGNMMRTIRYTQGAIIVTETIIIPKNPYLNIRVPVKPDTLKKEFLNVVVDKSHYYVAVWYRKRIIRSYKAVFGPKPLMNKCVEGDRCTPEGWFKIASKNPKSQYNKFLGLNYPNDSTLANFNKLKAEGAIPQNARPGGSVGIHGIWPGGDDMIELGVGWTDGCIALKNKDIDDLYSLVSVGTVVHIKR